MVFVPVFQGCAVKIFFKCFREITGAVKSGFAADFRDIKTCVKQQWQGSVQPVAGKIRNRSPGKVLVEQGAAAAFADMSGICDHGQGEGFFVMVLDKRNHLPHSCQLLPFGPAGPFWEIFIQRDPQGVDQRLDFQNAVFMRQAAADTFQNLKYLVLPGNISIQRNKGLCGAGNKRLHILLSIVFAGAQQQGMEQDTDKFTFGVVCGISVMELSAVNKNAVSCFEVCGTAVYIIGHMAG